MEWFVPIVPMWPQATTFERLPERVDVIGFVLQIAGLFAIVGTAIGMGGRRARAARLDRSDLAERLTVFGATVALGLFLVFAAIQRLH